jgi:hypothetical protein
MYHFSNLEASYAKYKGFKVHTASSGRWSGDSLSWPMAKLPWQMNAWHAVDEPLQAHLGTIPVALGERTHSDKTPGVGVQRVRILTPVVLGAVITFPPGLFPLPACRSNSVDLIG